MQAESSWDEIVDFVTVGSGAGALCAALVAHSQGKSVLVLEKQTRVGGTSAQSGGAIWIPFNHLMQREQIADSFDEARKYVDANVKAYGGATTPARIDAYLHTGPKMLLFLESQGIKLRRADGYSDYFDERPGSKVQGRAVVGEFLDSRELGDWAAKLNRFELFTMPTIVSEINDLTNVTRTWRGRRAALRLGMRLLKQKLRGAPIFGQGRALQGRILKEVISRGIDIRLDAPVTNLVVENGTVVGVVATCKGRPIRVRGKHGVLINAGGFAHNLPMRQAYLPAPQISTDYTLANTGDTGEIMQLAIDLGAALDQMDEAWWTPGSRLPNGVTTSHSLDLTKPHCIMVDSAAERYVDEAMAYMALGQAMFAHHRKIGAVPSWAIFDSRHRRRYTWGLALPGKTPALWLESGYMRRADSIEALAAMCDLNPTALRATAERFNAFARNGRDEDFRRGDRYYDRMGGDPTCKPNPTLGTLEEAPFYAVQIHVGDIGTCGGLMTDENGRVLREDGAAIPGLYACGNSAANCMGRSYPGPGVTLGQSYIFGYRAALHALGINSQHK